MSHFVLWPLYLHQTLQLDFRVHWTRKRLIGRWPSVGLHTPGRDGLDNHETDLHGLNRHVLNHQALALVRARVLLSLRVGLIVGVLLAPVVGRVRVVVAAVLGVTVFFFLPLWSSLLYVSTYSCHYLLDW